MIRTALVLSFVAALAASAFQTSVAVQSPNRKVSLAVAVDGSGQVTWTVTRDGATVIEPSPVGIRVDGIDLGKGATLGKAATYRVDEKYAWRGVKSEAVNRANGARIPVRHTAGHSYTLDVRVFDDGVAFRHEVPGTGSRVPDAGTTFKLPAGSTVWTTSGIRAALQSTAGRRTAVAPAPCVPAPQ